MTTLVIDHNAVDADGRAVAFLHDAHVPGPVAVGDVVRVTDLEHLTGYATVLEVDGDTVWLVPDLDELEHLAMYRFTAAAVLAPEPAPKKVTVLATGELYLG